MDIKSILEQTGYKVKENRFLKAPAHPYIVFHDDQVHRGADTSRSLIVEHSTTVELYVTNLDEKEPMNKLENILDDLNTDYSRSVEWIESDSNFKVSYGFETTDKKLKGGK